MKIFAIAGRELKALLRTSTGWMVLAGFLALSGVFWSAMVSVYVTESADGATSPYGVPTLTYVDHLLAPYFGNTIIVLMMVVPAVSMRLFSEELRERSFELLLTSPVTSFEIVLGKFFGGVGFVAVMLGCTAYVPGTMVLWADPSPGALAGGYLALFLVATSILSIGILCSASTANPVVALVWTFAGALIFWLLSWIDGDPTSWMGRAAMITHVQDMIRGSLRMSDLAYFGALIGFFLWATWQRVEGFRWR